MKMETRKNKIKSIYLFLPLLLLLSCKSEPEKKVANDSKIIQNSSTKDSIIGRGTFLTDEELEYIKTRDRYIEYFKNHITKNTNYNDSIFKQEKGMLLALEKLLHEILKDSRVKDGKINLETIIPDLGFGMLDGLTIEKDSLTIFCTTKGLFLDYFQKEKSDNSKMNEFNKLNSKELVDVFSSAFISDAGLTDFTSVKLLTSTSNREAYGMIGVVAQDEDKCLPEDLFVFVTIDNYVYLVHRKFEKRLAHITKCTKTWDSINLEAQKYFDKYRSSNLKDTMAYKRTTELENEAWGKYCNCYQKMLKSESQFKMVQKEMERIVDYIEH